MKVIVAAARGVLAIALTFIVINAAKADPATVVAAMGGVITAIVTVDAIDVPNRLLTVVGPDGNAFVIKLGPDVQHIEKIKVKEKVTINYTEEVATGLERFAGPPKNKDQSISSEEEAGMNMNPSTVAEQDWVEVTPKGDTDFSTVEVSDTVAAINYNKRTITFAGTGGKTRTIVVGPSVAGLDQIHVGDQVALEVTRAVAVDVKTL
jgi:hypothetical protein